MNEESKNGMKRKKNKALFNKNTQFFKMVVRNWLGRQENQQSIAYFYNGLQQLFFKTSTPNGIDKKIWNFSYTEMMNK